MKIAMVRRRLCLALLGLVLLNAEHIASHKFYVGDREGWTYSAENWPTGKTFHAKNVLVFKYDSGIHNVVRVNKHGYKSCLPNEKSKTYNSGNDHINLDKGTNYFICSFAGHCRAGMRLAIKAV